MEKALVNQFLTIIDVSNELLLLDADLVLLGVVEAALSILSSVGSMMLSVFPMMVVMITIVTAIVVVLVVVLVKHRHWGSGAEKRTRFQNGDDSE